MEGHPRHHETTNSDTCPRLLKLAPVCIWDDHDPKSPSSPAYDAEVERAAKNNFHPGVDFLDVLADGIESWLHGGDETLCEKVRGLRCFFWGIATDDHGDATPAWEQARAWIEAAGLATLMDSFVRRTKAVRDAVEALWLDLKDRPYCQPSPDDLVDLGVDSYIEDLRNWSRALKVRFDPAKPAKTPKGEGDGKKNRRGAPIKPLTLQRADFAKPLRVRGLPWSEVYERYVMTAQGKADRKANHDVMRLAYRRIYVAKQTDVSD